MKQILLSILFFNFFIALSNAQLPNGSTAPDFTTTDIYGETHNLYDYLEQGYTVILKFTATWCGPCWGYHNSGALEDAWDTYGPDGTNEAIVLFLESDPSTSVDCLYGNCSNTQGNWVAGTNFPIINDHSMAGPYQISYYPTVIGVCPSKKTTLLGPVPSGVIGNFIQNCAIISYDSAVDNVSCKGYDDGVIALVNVSGAEPISYVWSNGATGPYIDNLSPGVYKCTMTDAFGNVTETGQFVINEPDFLNLEVVNLTHIDCYNTEGYIAIQGVGGNGGNSYFWSTGQNGNQLFTNQGGIFSAVVIDSKSCTNSIEVEVEYNVDGPSINAGPGFTIPCNAQEIVLQGFGPSGPEFIIEWTTVDGNILYGASTYSPTVNAAGTYILNVFNFNTGCSSSDEVDVADADGFDLSWNVGEISCAGEMDGSVTVIPVNGNGPYTYLWSNGGVSSTINNLSGGNYEVTVNDASGCSKTAIVSLNEPDLLSVDIIAVNESSHQANDGILIAVTSGGTGSYSYLWSTGETSASINNLAPGIYGYTVTDDRGCDATGSVEIMPFTCDIDIIVTQEAVINCFGEATASASVTVEGGSNFTFSWSNGDTGGTISNLTAGTYYVTVEDNSNCILVDSIVISQPAAIEITLYTQQITMPGEDDGRIAASVTGGTGPYDYIWSNGELTDSISYLPAGTYTLTITDANGCEKDASAVINNAGCSLNIGLELIESVLCHGDSTAVVGVNVEGNAGNVYFEWSNNIESTSEIAENLSAGTYFVTVTDDDGCREVADITVGQPSLLQVSIFTGEITEAGGTDGTAVADVEGGTGPYTYQWSTGAITPEINGLSAGVYSVTVTDSNDCYVEAIAVISAFSCTFDLDIIVEREISCFGASDGALQAIHTSNNGMVSYFWSNESTGSFITDAGAGVYYVIGIDSLFCTDTAYIELLQPQDLQISFTVINESSEGAGDGSIVAHVTGGTNETGYIYEWSTGGNSGSVDNLSAGDYCLTVTDNNGCQNTYCGMVFVSGDCDELSIDVVIENHVVCYGTSSGNVTIVVQGGTTPYNIFLDSENSLTELPSGNYLAIVEDAVGCTASLNFEILEPAGGEMLLQMVDYTEVISESGTGYIEVNITGGWGGYSILWKKNGEIIATEGLFLTGLSEGVYEIEVSDASGCTKQLISDIILSTRNNEISLFHDVRVFPNPVIGDMKIDWGQNVNLIEYFEIISASGKMIMRNTLQKDVIAIGDLPAGLYLLKLNSSTENYTIKFIKL